jgi:formylglycine-generating enzyme required for sulfatase activity
MKFSTALMSIAMAAGLALTAHAEPAKPGKTFHDCEKICPVMVDLPSGQFVIGSPETETDRDKGEGPQKRLKVHRFAIGKYDVTRGQWAAFVADTHRPVAMGCAWAGPGGPALDPQKAWNAVDFSQDDSHPAVCVSFADAQDYAKWLSVRTGHTYRLPSEAEWEYAARAGTNTVFPWGDTPGHDKANYGAEACCSGLSEGADQWTATSPVGSFPPNGFGLYDMNGNVLQWVQDCLGDYADKPADGTPYAVDTNLKEGGPWSPKMVGLKACSFRMLRGGDWGDPPRMIRSAFRNYAPPKGATIDTYRSAGAGFRVVREY